ncbi:MAG: prolipoprotein diacylglyceryl transferase [Bacilli bacterium]|jgi:prolipoprotein diacylglyceryl transferase|nr:prolipoprotein diacylglyceryl transferase [Bacilli bacterium]
MYANFVFWLGILVTLVGGGLFYLYFSAIFKANNQDISFKNIAYRKLFIAVITIAIGFPILFAGIIAMNEISGLTGYKVMTIGGGLLFGLAFSAFLFGLIFFFGKDNAGKFKRIVKYSAIIGGLLSLIAIFIVLDGFTYLELITYPLVYQIVIYKEFSVHFYALFILSGAILVYFICDHYFYIEYGKHGLIENLFYIAFPAGIVGARLWYVIGNWYREGFNERPLDAFAVWDGGLAIMGGALLGGIVGILFLKWRRKWIPTRHAADLIVPTILIAQAIGRWGNFFNQEVYGSITNSAYWWFLPEFIVRQMTISGSMRVPLFLIEGIVNLAGYFIIRYAVGRGLKKYTKMGDLALLYVVWYGLTRFILEPMRDPAFNMGTNDKWSWIWSIVFIALGVLAIIANHLYERYHTPKAGKIDDGKVAIKVKK